MKKKFFVLSVFLSLIFLFSATDAHALEKEKIYLGGMPAGFTLTTRGVEVVGICDVVNKDKIYSPSKEAGILVGDVILCIDDVEVNCIDDVANAIKGKNSVVVKLKRSQNYEIITVLPAKDTLGENKLGIFIKNGVSGIGTITYIKGNTFASLGHPVVDEKGNLLNVLGGSVYYCNVTGCVKGVRGKAGELKGVFLRTEPIGIVEKNNKFGVFGKINDNFSLDNLLEIEIGQAIPGDACICTTILGKVAKRYQISIIKSDTLIENKNFVIKITDNDLLDATNGIVQGMSGSPILQNGKLVGAVTHVFVNDPTRGFGIDIDKMLNS